MFRLLRKILFWLHLIAGVAAGLVILLIAVTGLTISFERQITAAANGFKIAVPAEARKLGVEELLAAVQTHDPAKAPSGLVIESDPAVPVAVQYGKEKTLFVDPYTGAMLGEGAKKTRSFFQFVTSLHRWMAFRGSAKDVGQSINSAAALVFFFMILTGLFLWLPKRWTRRGVLVITTFQRQLKGRARDWNWHNVLGIWFALPLLVISATGLTIAYPWATALLFRLAGDTPPPAGGGKVPPPGPAAWPDSFAGWNAAWNIAAKASGDWQSIQFQFPPQKQQAVFNVSDSHRGRPDLRQTVTVDLATVAVTKTETFSGQSAGKRLRTWARWVHTGEAGGWPGQVLAAFSAASAAVLVWTGLALSWRRFVRWRKKEVN